MAPPFIFRVDELRQREGTKGRVDVNGDWQPPRPLGYNVITEPRLWMLNGGQRNQPSSYVHMHAGEALPDSVQLFKEYSMYHCDGTFWVAPYDAARHVIGDGTQDDKEQEEREGSSSSSSSTDTEDESEQGRRPHRRRRARPREPAADWSLLGFGLPDPYQNDYTSYATTNVPRTRLHVQHRGQHAWINELLPDRYHAERRNGPERYGGMVGELPILIGLIAFSVVPRNVPSVLSHCINGAKWQTHGYSRGDGWIDKRGLVVRTYISTRHPESTAEELHAFENGQRGKAYP